MPPFEPDDRALFAALHALVFDDAECRALIEARLEHAARRFDDADYAWPYSSQPVPVELFHAKLSPAHRAEIGLCRVFTIQAGARLPHPERHRNSVQRLCAFRGEGAVHCGVPGAGDTDLVPYGIVSPDLASGHGIERCWDVVVPDTWHFPEARGEAQWFGVAFHSATEAEIEDEYSSRRT